MWRERAIALLYTWQPLEVMSLLYNYSLKKGLTLVQETTMISHPTTWHTLEDTNRSIHSNIMLMCFTAYEV